MSIPEAQASTMEARTPSAFEEHAVLEAPTAPSPPSTPAEEDLPAGTAGRAAALGL